MFRTCTVMKQACLISNINEEHDEECLFFSSLTSIFESMKCLDGVEIKFVVLFNSKHSDCLLRSIYWCKWKLLECCKRKKSKKGFVIWPFWNRYSIYSTISKMLLSFLSWAIKIVFSFEESNGNCLFPRRGTKRKNNVQMYSDYSNLDNHPLQEDWYWDLSHKQKCSYFDVCPFWRTQGRV